jgi:hypothetical protein
VGWITDLAKEVPLSAVLKERLTEAEQKFREKDEEVATLTAKVAALTADNEALRRQLAYAAERRRFVERKGVLFGKDGGGEYIPYCLRCKLPLSKLPPWSPDLLKCSACKFVAPFHPDELPAIVAGIEG